jgi:hypothetical protein
MMSPEALAQAIETLILNADSRYISAIGRVQADLYNQLSVILKELELDGEGYIKQSAANRRVLTTADKKINEVFSSTIYTTAVSNYVAVVPRVDLQNVKYFTAIDETFKPNKLFLKNLQSDTIATIEKYVLQDGLQSQVINPLSQILNQNVNSGGRFDGFLQQVRDYVLGNDKVEGRAMSYTRTYLRDSLFTYSRTFQQSITNDLGLEYYLYSGGLIDKSRPFCIEHSGKFYHHKEIEAWAAQEWAGKKQGTTESSIFLFAGGWNCSHEIIPVHVSIVPKEVIERQ